MLTRDLEEALLEQGIRRGTVTFGELNEAFPAEYFPLDEMEHFLERLEDIGVRVIDHDICRRPRHPHKRAA